MSIGSNIRRRRRELGISQKELAEAVGYSSRSAIANIETGASELPASRLLDLARALDTSVESLLMDIGPAGSVSADLRQRSGTRNGAIILAGGRSTRNLQRVPNQFVSVLGRPVIAWCLDAYQRHPLIDDILVVCLEGWEDLVSAYADQAGISKLRGVVRAGDTGVRSVALGLRRLEEMGYREDDTIVVQESTRPLVTEESISRVLLACGRGGSAVTCAPMADNVQFVRTGEDGWTYVNRDDIVDLQSPDAYVLSVLEGAIQKAEELGDPMRENSCAMLFHALGLPLNFSVCDTPNMKIVRQEDLAVFEALARRRSV